MTDLGANYDPPRESPRVEKLCANPFLKEMVDFYLQNEERIPWSNTAPTLQSSVHTHLPETDDVMAGCGKLIHLPGPEFEFKHLALRYRDTVIEKMFDWIPFKVRRLRWMRLLGKSCYSIHRDPTPRIHIPLITAPEACFIFPNDGAVHLEAGGIYLVDTTQFHSFMNGNENQRIHLVGALEP